MIFDNLKELIIIMSWHKWFCPKKRQGTDDDHSHISADERFQHNILPQKERQGQKYIPYITYGEDSFQGQYWAINKQKYQKGKWQKLFRQIKSIPARYLMISAQVSKDIPNQIRQIVFPNLKALYLKQNMIISTEPFQKLDAPNLMDLDLRSNRITQIRSLRKCCFKLDHLLMQNNPIAQFNGLSAINFYKSIQKTYVTNFHVSYPSDIQKIPTNLTNISQFAKSEPKYIFDHFPKQENITFTFNKLQIQCVKLRDCPCEKIQPNQ